MASSGGLTSFSFNSNTLSVAAGGTGQLTLALDSADLSAEVDRTVTFTSSDTSTATVAPGTATIQVATHSYSITVTGVSAGSATITATCTDSQGTAWTSTATITVTNATQVIVAEQSLQDIADAIRGKLGVATTYKPADMASAIESISGGGGTPSFWTGGLNPQHIQTVTMTHNLSADTSYNSTTPTTTAKTILIGTPFRETMGPLDMANYDYALFMDLVTPHKYTELPSVNHMLAVGTKIIYFIGRRYNSNAASAKQGVILTLGAAPIAYYENSSQTKYTASAGTYGIGYAASAPSLVSSSADSANIYVYSPSITVRTHATYMNANAWQYIDPTATNIYIRYQLFRVDKMGVCSGAFDMVRNACIDGDGTMATNAIIYGGSGS